MSRERKGPSRADGAVTTPEAQPGDAFTVMERDGEIVGHSPSWFGSHVFGGILLAQSLDAARSTAPAAMRARSLHAYFLSAATADAPIRYEVDPTKDGRSASTRTVTASQHERLVLTAQCSFARDRDGPTYDLPPDDHVPEPEVLATRPGPGPFEFAFVGPTPERADGSRLSTHRAWVRIAGELPDDTRVHESALCFLSDLTWTAATPWKLAGAPDRSRMVSVDHAVWLHRTARADEWLFFDVHSLVHAGGRGTIRGVLSGRDRRVVASMAQEMQFR
jgi:acyl-CoA thioesterase II